MPAKTPRAFGDALSRLRAVVDDPVRCEVGKYILLSRLRAQAVNA